MMSKKGDVVELGRSMIEMLGVLAIVGILSVGGIAGFHKAMTKHKINQLTEEFSQFISQILNYSTDFRRIHKNNTSKQLIAVTDRNLLNFITPSTWTSKNGGVYDSMKNRLIIYVRNDLYNDMSKRYLSLDYQLTKRNDSEDLCISLFNLAKTYDEDLFYLTIWRKDAEEASSASAPVFGKNYCSKGRKCLNDLTLNDIITKCNVCAKDDKACIFLFIFPL